MIKQVNINYLKSLCIGSFISTIWICFSLIYTILFSINDIAKLFKLDLSNLSNFDLWGIPIISFIIFWTMMFFIGFYLISYLNILCFAYHLFKYTQDKKYILGYFIFVSSFLYFLLKKSNTTIDNVDNRFNFRNIYILYSIYVGLVISLISFGMYFTLLNRFNIVTEKSIGILISAITIFNIVLSSIIFMYSILLLIFAFLRVDRYYDYWQQPTKYLKIYLFAPFCASNIILKNAL